MVCWTFVNDTAFERGDARVAAGANSLRQDFMKTWHSGANFLSFCKGQWAGFHNGMRIDVRFEKKLKQILFMVSSKFSVEFDFAADQGQLRMRLAADVEKHQSQVYYVVKNFRLPGRSGSPVLPDIRIRKLDDRWVHSDIEKASELSESVGRAIEQQENLSAISPGT